MYLLFDTETTGLPKDWKAPVSDLNNWPRLVELAWIQFDGEGNLIQRGDVIIRPDGFMIPAEAANIHGISNIKAMEEGLPLKEVMTQFKSLIEESQIIVGHNISFDRKIVGCELLRCELEDVLHGKERICTMFSSSKFCAIPNIGRAGIKWPKLQELHNVLFKEDFEEAHNAGADISATARCFWELIRIGVISKSI